MEQNNLDNNLEINKLGDDAFEFVGAQAKEAALKTKPQGYYSDVFKRFIKKKSSIVAIALVAILLIFSLIMPLMYSFDQKMSEPDFVRTRPKNIFSDGSYTRTVGESEYYSLVGVGVAAQFDDNNPNNIISINESMGKPFQPVKSNQDVTLQFMEHTGQGHILKIDSYLESGFTYKTVTVDQAKKILDFEKSSGKRVIYPMVDRYSEYERWDKDENGIYTQAKDEEGNPITEIRSPEYVNNANFWYDVLDLANEPLWNIDNSGKPTSKNELKPNYLHFDPKAWESASDEEKEAYKELNGGNLPNEGDIQNFSISVSVNTDPDTGEETRTLGVSLRVLVYNYFIYEHGTAPAFWFGTNNAGQDIFSRLAGGLRMSLLLALLVAIISLLIGVVIGSFSGYYGGRTDLIMGRIQDILIGLPVLVILSLIYLNWVEPGKIPMFLGLLLGFVLFSWVGYARLIRTQFFRYKNNEYVLASKTLGAKDRRLMFKHIFPNTLGTLITQFALAIPAVILTEVVMYFLGILSITDGGATLGIMINEGSAYMTTAPYIIIFPVVVFGILMYSFNLLGNALRDAFDPSQRGK